MKDEKSTKLPDARRLSGCASSRLEAASQAQSRRLQIWLVDDDHEFSQLWSRLLNLESAVYCGRQFDSAAAVLAALKSGSAPDVILLDVQMPGMSGLEALPIIRQIAPCTPVLIVTTFANPSWRAQALANGAVNFLRKGCPVQEVLASLPFVQAKATFPVPAHFKTMAG